VKPVGFAALSPERRREISSKGGKAAHVAGTAHEFLAGSAKTIAAGRKGGIEVHRRKREGDTIPAPPPEVE
jgi:general stress protein YciG